MYVVMVLKLYIIFKVFFLWFVIIIHIVIVIVHIEYLNYIYMYERPWQRQISWNQLRASFDGYASRDVWCAKYGERAAAPRRINKYLCVLLALLSIYFALSVTHLFCTLKSACIYITYTYHIYLYLYAATSKFIHINWQKIST